MNRQGSNIIVALAAFLGGVSLGLLWAPRSGRDTRDQLATHARTSGNWIEAQVKEANSKIRATGEEIAGKIRMATQEVVDQIIPDLATDSEEWDQAYVDAARAVRKMK